MGGVAGPLDDELAGPFPAGLLVLLGAVGFLLLIACGNVANLMLVRAARREGELAIRHALGAGCGRLARQLLVESVVLAAIGGLAGLVFAGCGIDLMRALVPAVGSGSVRSKSGL